MKKTTVALAVMALVMTSAHAAEIFNKGGNKIDLYGKVKGEHDFKSSSNSDSSYARMGFKGETQISDQ